MNDGNSGNNYSYTFISDNTGAINQGTSSPQQNALYVTVLNSNGTTTTTFIVARDGSVGSSDSDTDKGKDKKDNSHTMEILGSLQLFHDLFPGKGDADLIRMVSEVLKNASICFFGRG